MHVKNLNPSVVQIILSGIMAAAGSNAKRISMTFYYYRALTVLATHKPSLHTSFATVVGVPFLAAVHQDFGTFTTKIRWMNDRTDAALESAIAGAGAIATQRLPIKDTVVMALGAGKRGGQFISRKFFAGASEADTTGDVLTGAGLGRWQALRDALLVNLGDTPGNVWSPIILQGKPLTNLKVNPTDLEFEPATTCKLNLNISDLDKRKVVTVH